MNIEQAIPPDDDQAFVTQVFQPADVDPREYAALGLTDEEFAKYKALSAGKTPDSAR